MKRNLIFLITAFMLVMIQAAFSGCAILDDEVKPSEDEILLKISLDLKEDIGLLVIDDEINGEKHSGGISNANKTMLGSHELLYWTFDRDVYKDTSESLDIKIKFSVVTEYVEPNYENDYPEELVKETEEISFTAGYGKAYHVTITGDRKNGYRAEFGGED